MPSIRNGTTLSDPGNRLKRSTYCSECPKADTYARQPPGRSPHTTTRMRRCPRPLIPSLASQGKASRFSGGDCVVESVGLEPTTKVLWNMVGVRPTPLVGHPSTYRKLCCFA